MLYAEALCAVIGMLVFVTVAALMVRRTALAS
jgi:hypothetical protein